MAHVRPYRPSVRVGNWFEDIALEEDKLRIYLEKKQRGELVVQRVGDFIGESTRPVTLSSSADSFVHFGDTVCLLNPGAPDPCGKGSRKSSLLSANFSFDPAVAAPKDSPVAGSGDVEVTGSCVVEPSSRTAFVVERADTRCGPSEALRYGEKFYLRLANTEYYLCSEPITFQRCARKSRHQLIYLARCPSQSAEWKVLHSNPQIRMEMEFQPVHSNALTVISHAKTNCNLSIEEAFSIRTFMGYEYEVSAHNFYDTHKAEKENSLWVFFMPPFQNLEAMQK